MSLFMPLASLTAFSEAYNQSDLFGKVVILSLLGLSIVCWIVLIYKIWVIQKVKKISLAFQKALEQNKEAFLDINIRALPKPKNTNIPHPFADIFDLLKEKTLEMLNKNYYFLSQGGERKASVYLTANDLEFLEAQGISIIAVQYKKLEKNLFILSTIITLAPFMGLLGTVWGILVSFAGLNEGASVGSNSAILGGLSTALATTVLGLIIAIPALISYNYLRNSLHSYSSDMDNFLTNLIANVGIQYRKPDFIT